MQRAAGPRGSLGPLLLYVALAISGAAFAHDPSKPSDLVWYWAWAGSAGLVLLAWWSGGRRRVRVGHAAGWAVAVVVALLLGLVMAFPSLFNAAWLLACLVLLTWGAFQREPGSVLFGLALLLLTPLTVAAMFGGLLIPMVLIDLGLVALGIWRRRTLLAASAVAFATLAALAPFVANALAPWVNVVFAGLLLVAVGLITWRRQTLPA